MTETMEQMLVRLNKGLPSLGYAYFKEARIKWRDRRHLQDVITNMCNYIEHLEQENKRLIEKNNELIEKKA